MCYLQSYFLALSVSLSDRVDVLRMNNLKGKENYLFNPNLVPRDFKGKVLGTRYGELIASRPYRWESQGLTNPPRSTTFPAVNTEFDLRFFRDFAAWAVCPDGYFLRGINVEETNPLIGSGYSFDAMYLLVDDITQGQCCRPKHHPSEWESCYDENIWSPFDRAGWVSCSVSEDYFIAGFYKNVCDNLFCIENLRCCSMKTIQG